MREIRFRAYEPDDKIMLDIKSIEFENEFVTIKTDEYEEYDGKADEFHIMQYTGLKDKHGVCIYEGDIVKNSLKDMLEVIWNEDRCCFEMRGRYSNSHVSRSLDCDIVIDLSIEVVGNIYENKGLLDD